MTADPRIVMGILQDARELVRADWGNSNVEVDANGMHCASVGIKRAASPRRLQPLANMAPGVMEAHAAFLRAVDVPVSTEDEEVLATVYLWNDSQASVGPVLAGFDKAIANLEAELEPTPQADATLAVMAVCDQAGDVLARQIVSEHPEMPFGEVAAMASSEFFYAAQDTAKACSHGTKLVRA